jgi:hypothetical protein
MSRLSKGDLSKGYMESHHRMGPAWQKFCLKKLHVLVCPAFDCIQHAPQVSASVSWDLAGQYVVDQEDLENKCE